VAAIRSARALVAGPPSAAGSFLPGLGNGIANNSNLLIGLGAGLWSGGLGRGIQEALTGGALDQKQRAANLAQQSTYAALKARGISEPDATAAALNPEMLRMIIRNRTRQELLRLAPEARDRRTTEDETEGRVGARTRLKRHSSRLSGLV
jgi:hypothetical protein